MDLDNVLLAVARNKADLLTSEELILVPTMNLKERALIFSLLWCRLDFEYGHHIRVYENVKLLARHISIIEIYRILDDLRSILLSLEYFELYAKINKRHEDVIREIFEITEICVDSERLFAFALNVLTKSVQAVFEAYEKKCLRVKVLSLIEFFLPFITCYLRIPPNFPVPLNTLKSIRFFLASLN